MGNKKLWVSDLIGDDYKAWHNEAVILDCGTGSGKTTFCLDILATHAEKMGKTMLYLCNREKLKCQVEEDVSRFGHDNITVATYQRLQEMVRHEGNVEKYDYILADECHYFFTDSKFNEYTDLAYEYLAAQTEAVVVYMSATAQSFFKWLIVHKRVSKNNVYAISKDYSYVKGIYFYKKNHLPVLIDNILDEDDFSKILVFCNSGRRLQEMYARYGERANYYCSKHSKDEALKKICHSEDCFEVDEADGTMTFKKRILFTTSALDNGINLQDRRLQYIFSELLDVDTMIQAFGRKRSIDEHDTCFFYIKEYSPQAIQGLLNTNAKDLYPAKLYLEDYVEFYDKYGAEKDRKIKENPIFYMRFGLSEDGRKSKTICINRMKYNKFMMDNKMLTQMKEQGYVNVVLSAFSEDLAATAEVIDIKVPVKDEFLEYLQSIENRPLYQEDREEVKKRFESIGLKMRYLGINTFNGALDDCYKDEYKKRFTNKDISTGKFLVDKRRLLDDGKENPNRDKKYWLLR